MQSTTSVLKYDDGVCLQLNPNASEEGVNKRQFYKQKFGARADSIVSTMTVRVMTETFIQHHAFHFEHLQCQVQDGYCALVNKFDLTESALQETFANEGLQYNMDGLTGNTLNSHRLIAFAGQKGPEKQNALVDALFKAYFTEV